MATDDGPLAPYVERRRGDHRVVVLLRCGGCGRVLDELWPVNSWSLTGTSPVFGRGADARAIRRRRPPGELTVERTLAVQHSPRPHTITRVAGPPDNPFSRMRFQCVPVPLCGRDYVFKSRRLVRGWLAAVERGRRDMTAGVDL